MTATQLARYLGQPVWVVNHGIADTPDSFTGSLVTIDLFNESARVEHIHPKGLQSKVHVELVKPILRPLSSLTKLEQDELFRLAFGFEQAPAIRRRICFEDKWMLMSDESFFTNDKVLWIGKTLSTGYVSKSLNASVDALAAYAFLDSIGIDYTGLIERGEAVKIND